MLQHLIGAFIGSLFCSLGLILLVFSLPGSGSPPSQVEAQNCTGDTECDPTVRPASRSPGARTSYEVTFMTPVEIVPHTGSIVMVLHEDIRVPRSIGSARVRVGYRSGAERIGGFASDVSLNDQDNPRRPTTINIAHGLVNNNSQVPIPVGAVVTVTFSSEAGISNPTEGGSYAWEVGVGSDSHLVNANHPVHAGDPDIRKAFRLASADGKDTGLLVDREVQLSRQEASRGQSVTVTARGYGDGRTLTVWRDANLDGQRDPGERVLCEVVVGSNGTGRCEFTAFVPPFVGGFGECEGGSDLNCNFVNGAQGSGGSSIIIGRGSDLIYQADQALELVGRIVAESVQGPGGQIRLVAIDLPAGVITKVTIGGVAADFDPVTVGTSSRLSFSVTVPNSVRLGRQPLRVDGEKDSGGDFSYETIVDITQPSIEVRIVPEMVMANQRVSIFGQVSSAIDGMSIEEVEFGGFVVEPSRVNGGEGKIDVAEDGSWWSFLDLPIVEAAMVAGTHELRVRDSLGRTGSVEVTVPPREVTVNPVSARPGSIITVSGAGFPSRNDHGSTVVIRIIYESSNGPAMISTETDSKGNFTQDIRIPLKTASPSSNVVRVEFDDDAGITVATTIRHEVPAPVVQLSAEAGPPGSIVTLTGTGFRHYAPVESAMFGDIDVSPGHGEPTGAMGEFSFDFLVPELGVGQHTLRVTVAGVTAIAIFEITESGVAPGAAMPVSLALGSLEHRLLRIFHFNNDTKEWTFYDPDLGDLNTLSFMVAGETYLVLVSETTEAVLNGRARSLTCLGDNCWSQIVW